MVTCWSKHEEAYCYKTSTALIYMLFHLTLCPIIPFKSWMKPRWSQFCCISTPSTATDINYRKRHRKSRKAQQKPLRGPTAFAKAEQPGNRFDPFPTLPIPCSIGRLWGPGLLKLLFSPKGCLKKYDLTNWQSDSWFIGPLGGQPTNQNKAPFWHFVPSFDP